ncbi:hypothetical protein BC827DRAFT_1097306, partial [Russula dissimulans]
DDDGAEREPEDSESPWTCSLVLPLVSFDGPVESGEGSELIRARVTTFSLTPHHSKVVALPKVPFLLPDIIVDRLQVWYRTAELEYRVGVGQARAHGGREIMDVVSSTGLWLVVRARIDGVWKTGWKGVGCWIRA